MSEHDFKMKVWAVVSTISDNLKIEPDQSVSYNGSTNDVDEIKDLTQELFEELFINGPEFES